MKRAYFTSKKQNRFTMVCLLAIVGLIIQTNFLYASTHSVSEAQRIAIRFFSKSAGNVSGIQRAPLSPESVQLTYESASDAVSPLYVFQNNQRGFVVLLQQDNEFKVVGYSDKPTFDAQNIPSNVRALFLNYEKNQYQSVEGISFDKVSTTVVEPLLDKAGVNLNQFKHEIAGNCPTGCVATAMAQIMCYYKYPQKGIGSRCYTLPAYGELCADFQNTTYNWVNPTEEDFYKLSQHVGIAMKMGYCSSPFGSVPLDGDYQFALNKYFGYSCELLGELSSDSKLLMEIIQQQKPIYCALPGDPGHAVVLDGYDVNGFLHINFGWGGVANGFYLLNSNSTVEVGYRFGTNVVRAVLIQPGNITLNKEDSIVLDNLNKKNATLNWDLSNPNKCHGITILNGRVVGLYLDLANNIGNEGGIPQDIENLSELRILSIFGKLHGSIPKSITKLTKLYSLSVTNNEGTLNDSIPVDIGNLSNLSFLSFNNCIKGGIPASIGNLKNLKTLSFTSCSIDKPLPSEISNLSSVQSLIISECKLPGSLPMGIGNLKELIYLNLSNNQLTGSLPAGIGELKKLTTLELSKNNFSGIIPTELINCDALTRLVLNDNKFEGGFPSIFSNMSNINALELSNNGFTTLPESIGKLTKLTKLNLNNNALTALPDSLNELINLEQLSANSNKISKLPANMNKFSKLISLDLSYNEIAEFPEELCFYPNLTTIFLNNNKIKRLPLMSADLQAIQLQIQNNELSGPIPAELLRTEISYYSFENNRFTYNDLPRGTDFVNKIGLQKPLQLSKNVFKANPGDTIAIDIRQICDRLNKNDKFIWCEHPKIKKQYQTLVEVEKGPVLHIVANERNLTRKFYCQVTNDSSAMYDYPGVYYKLECLPALYTDTVTIGFLTNEEFVAQKYPENAVVNSQNLLKKEVSDKLVTLISPFKMRGQKVWEASADGKSWHELSPTMTQNDLKTNLVTVKPEELKISPKTPAFYRCTLHEENCTPRYSDTLKINPYGKVICDTTLSVKNKTVTIQNDSIEVTIPQGITSDDFRLTIVKLDNPPSMPDTISKMGGVYDVTVSFADSFYLPIKIKFKNFDKKKFDLKSIDKYRTAYFDDLQQKWVTYENAHVNLIDSTITFHTYHLTKLGWYEIAHSGYTHIFTNNKVNVIYRYLDGYPESNFIYQYNKRVENQGLKEWQNTDCDPEKSPTGTPYLIQDIAYYTKQIIDKFQSIGIEVPDLRFNVYVALIGNNGMVDAGSYLAGRGYLYIDPQYSTIDPSVDENQNEIKRTLAHEYMHFTQDYYMTVMLQNYFWTEATAPIAARIVWGESVLDETESELLIKDALLPEKEKTSIIQKLLLMGRNKTIFEVLSESWLSNYNIPVATKIRANSADANLAALFLHYMQNYRNGDKLDAAVLLKETSYLDSWIGYLDSYIKKYLKSTTGDEYADYIQYIFKGENKYFTVLNKDEGHPLKYVIKNMIDGVDFAKYTNYNFKNFTPQKDKITFDVPYLASKMYMLNNMTADKATVVRYKRLTEVDENERTYYGKYNEKTKQMEIVEITDSIEYSFLLEARTEKSLQDYLNTGFLLFVNTRIPQLAELSNTYKVNIELTATPIPNFTSLNYADVTQDAIHSYSDGNKNIFFIQGRAALNVPGATFSVDNFTTSTEMIEDSIVRIKCSFSEYFKLPNGSGLPATIRKSDKSQIIDYDFITGNMEIEQNTIENNIWGAYSNDFSPKVHPEYTYEVNDIYQYLKLKNVKEFTPINVSPSLNTEAWFSTKNLQETLSTVDKIDQVTKTKLFDETGKLTGEKTVTYQNTTYNSNSKIQVGFNVK